ncbi:MAG: hypothetical protein NZZ41_00900 [Candidatus Dojkabacteria bacterium]|nr:hypothetical protein [Candidatus Dojkabacteria bacterium]
MNQTKTLTLNNKVTYSTPTDTYTYYVTYLSGNRWITFSTQSSKRANEEARKILMENNQMRDKMLLISRRKNYIMPDGSLKLGHGNQQTHAIARRVVLENGEVLVLINRVNNRNR